MGSEVLIPTFPIRNTASAPDCCHVGSFSKSLGLVLSSLPVLLVEVLLVNVVSRGSCGSGAISQRTHGHRYNSDKREGERNGEDMTRRTIESWVLASYYYSRRYISSIKSSHQLYSIMQQNTRKREIKRRTEREIKKGGRERIF